MRIAIIGGGAAGLMAAQSPALAAHRVTLFERNPFFGKKLRITGKGRCNVTNTCPVRDMAPMLPRGEKFLRSALYSFPPDEVRAFFEEAGVPLKEERGGRVFPVSDKAADVAEALVKGARAAGTVLCHERVLSLKKEKGVFLVKTAAKEEEFDRVLLATGGLSYPGTGSDGDGYRFAEALGHSIQPLRPALCPLTVKESLCAEAMGLSLRNVAVRLATPEGKCVYEDFGEMLFTHFGVSGPVILSASSFLDFDKHPFYRLHIDLKPALTREALDKRVLSDLAEKNKRDLVNALDDLLPQKLIVPFIGATGLDGRRKVHSLGREERLRLTDTMKDLPLTVTGHRPIKEAIVTRGGVCLKEIDPHTMGSRLVDGLYFAGEIIDADALTGGFNLQIAFSTARLAAEAMAKEEP
ncbi:MAG: NAD(P)/FAD-dependent oxidoreductase [Clostridia bacterium]|nr:NAD(P)/FAD-dependent oxidoreductase [Clostridia bacterium]